MVDERNDVPEDGHENLDDVPFPEAEMATPPYVPDADGEQGLDSTEFDTAPEVPVNRSPLSSEQFWGALGLGLGLSQGMAGRKQADDTDVFGLEDTVSSLDEARGANPMTDTTEYDIDLTPDAPDATSDAPQAPQDPILTIPKKEYFSPATKERWAKVKETMTKKRTLHNPFAGTGQRLDKIVKGTKTKAKLAGAYAAYHLSDVKDGYVDSFKKKKSTRVATYATLGAVGLATVGGIIVGTGHLTRDERSRPDVMNKTVQTGTQTAGRPKAAPLLPPAASIKTAPPAVVTPPVVAPPQAVAPPIVTPPAATSTAADYAASAPKAPLIGFTDAVLGTAAGTAATDTTATVQASVQAPAQIPGLSPAVTGTVDAAQAGAPIVPPASSAIPSVTPPVAPPMAPASAQKAPLIGFTDAVFKTELYGGKERRLSNPAFIVKNAGQERIVEISTRQHGLVRDHKPRYTLENTFDGHKVRIQGVAATPYNGKTSAHEIFDVSLKDTQSIELNIPADKYGRKIGVSLSPTFNSPEVRSFVQGTTLSAESLQGVKQYAKDGKLLLVYDVAARNDKGEIVQSYKAPIIITFDGEAVSTTTYGTVKQRASAPEKQDPAPAVKPAAKPAKTHGVVERSLEHKLDEQTIVYEQPVPQPLPPINVTGTQVNYNGTDATPSTVTIQSNGQETRVYENGQLKSTEVQMPIDAVIETPVTTNVPSADYLQRKQELISLNKEIGAKIGDLEFDLEQFTSKYARDCANATSGIGKYKDLHKQTETLKDCDVRILDLAGRYVDASAKNTLLKGKLVEFETQYGKPDFEIGSHVLDLSIPDAKQHYNSSTEVEIEK